MNAKKCLIVVLLTLLWFVCYQLFKIFDSEEASTQKKNSVVLNESAIIEGVAIVESVEHSKPIKSIEPFIVSCGKNVDKDGVHFGEVTNKLLLDEKLLLDKLHESNSVDAQLLYALLEIRQDEISESNKFKPLFKLTKEYPNNKLVNWHLLNYCANSQSSESCDKKVLTNARDLDSNNSAVWLTLAGIRASKGNVEGATYALRQASSSPFYNEFYSDNYAALDNALSEIGINDASQRFLYSVGVEAASEVGAITSVLKFCSANSKSRADIASYCIEVGERMLEGAKSYSHRTFGLGLQHSVYEKLGDQNAIESVKLKQLQSNSGVFSEQMFQAVDLLMFDQDLARYWLEKIKIHGEANAQKLLEEEAIRLSSNENYNPCQFRINSRL